MLCRTFSLAYWRIALSSIRTIVSIFIIEAPVRELLNNGGQVELMKTYSRTYPTPTAKLLSPEVH